MQNKFNVTGPKRKELVEMIAEVTGEKAKYRGMPSAAYDIGNITVSKDGTMVYDSRTADSVIQEVLEKAKAAGFIPVEEMVETTVETELQNEDGAETTGFVVSVPAESVNLENLRKLLKSKETLIRKAIGVPDLPVEEREEKIWFPWWDEMPDAEASAAYTRFIGSLCRMSLHQKRIQAKEKDVENEKYTFRCFLLRLGFIGKEYKTDRQILLKNLSGSAAFKAGKKGDK